MTGKAEWAHKETTRETSYQAGAHQKGQPPVIISKRSNRRKALWWLFA